MLTIGTAYKVINNELGTYVQSATAALKAKEIRDDLEANALFIDDGRTRILFVGCDLGGIESHRVAVFRKQISQASGIPERNILISCTHTHSGPSVVQTNYFMPVDEEYHERLGNWLAELAKEAVENSFEGRIGRALGEAKIGYNRRVCWADGSHSMHGDTTRPDFAGLEGPDDPSHLALYIEDDKGELKGVLYNNTTHPTNYFSQGIYSADFPGIVRRQLRELFGPVSVQFLNGAFGDIAIVNQMRKNRRNVPRELREAGVAQQVLGETIRLYGEAKFQDQPVIGHAYEDLEVEVRLPGEKALDESRKLLARVDNGEEIPAWDILFAHGTVYLQKTFGENPVDRLPVHAVRIGDVAIVTQPCELFCQFGLDIKRRSPTKYTGVVSITDGMCGYCPTIYGILGGGYSGKPIYWTRLAENAGYRIVETAGKLLHTLWRKDA